jgi:hypothetical protein
MMNLTTIKKISVSKKIRFFLEKSFGLEILFLLQSEGELEGIENTYQIILSPKPKYPAFKSFLIYLKDKRCINIIDGKTKKSSKILRLTHETLEEFSTIF